MTNDWEKLGLKDMSMERVTLRYIVVKIQVQAIF